MFDEDITLLCFYNREDISRIKKTFPNMTQENKNMMFEYLKNGISPIVVRNGEVINPKSKENIAKQKEVFNKRFSFIYENSKELIEFACPISGHLGFNFLKWLEEFLLGNKEIEDTDLYRLFMKEKKDQDIGYETDYYTMKMEHHIYNKARVIGENSKYMWELLSHLVYYISSRKDVSSYNNEKELEALDEYFRVLRYSNDGIEWVSGFNLEGEDLIHSLFLLNGDREEMVRYYDNPEFEGNEFLSCFASGPIGNDRVSLTEKEKQDLYLKFHDELPWDFIVSCSSNENLDLPSVCKPCDNSVLVQENDIFVDDNDNFYCMCNRCGYIIAIQKEGINSKVQKRIIDRCYPRKDLFRKMVIYSELQALDRETGIKVLEKKKEDSDEERHSYILSRFKNKRGN